MPKSIVSRILTPTSTLIAILVSGTVAQAVQPSHAQALDFGYQLQEEFMEKRSAIFADNLDTNAMWRRVFTPFGLATLNDPETPKLFKTQFLPSLISELKALDSYSVLFLSRVLLMNDARYLEFIIMNDEDEFQVQLVRLSQMTNGNIGISDLQMHGSYLEYSENLRATLIVLGVPAQGSLNDDEMTLKYYMPRIRPAFNQMLYEISQGQIESSFKQWLRASEDVKNTLFWRNLRARLVFLGSQAALDSLQNALDEGTETNTLLKLSYARGNQTLEGQLQLLDEALQAKQEMPFLRMSKAAILLELGDSDMALRLAQDIYKLTPFSISAYLIAVQAAHMQNDTKTELSILDQWAMVSSIEEIEDLLQSTPGLADYLSTRGYLSWRQRQDKPQ